MSTYPFDVSWQRANVVYGNNVYFLGNIAGTSYADDPSAGTRTNPFSTLDYAFSRCTASRGDVIVVLPGHAETTLNIGADVAGVRVLGLGYGRNRPTFTSSGTAADLLAVSAANIEMENVRLVGAAASCTALMNLTGVDFVGRKLSFEQAATPLVGVTIGAAHRFVLEDCTWLGTANGPDTAISLTTKCHDWRVVRPRFLFGQNGLDNELIKSVAACTGYLIEDLMAVGLDTLVINFASSSAGAPDGLITSGTVMYSAAVTSIEDGVAAATSKGAAFGRLWAVDATGKSAGLIPLTTAS